jgi:hypothetical protein
MVESEVFSPANAGKTKTAGVEIETIREAELEEAMGSQ